MRGGRGSITIDAGECPQKLSSRAVSTSNDSSMSGTSSYVTYLLRSRTNWLMGSEDRVVLGDNEISDQSADGTRHSDFNEQSHDHSSRRSPAMDQFNLLGDQSDSELSDAPSYLSSPPLRVCPDTQSVMETPLRPTVPLITHRERATEVPKNNDGSQLKQVTVDLDGAQTITRASQNRDSIERVMSQSFAGLGDAIDEHRDNLPIDLISSSANSQREPSPAPVQIAPIRMPRKRLATSKIIAMEPSPSQHGRKRTIPSDFDVDGPDTDPSAEVVPPKKASKPKRARGVWTTEHLLQNEKSKLVDVDLTKLLSDPRAWASLSDAEKRGVLEHLPSHVGASLDTNEVPSIPIEFLKYDNDWRNGLRLFQEDLSAGHFEPSWLEGAAEAMEARARGEFDDWKNAEYEAFWGQKQKLQYDVRAEDSARMKFGTLVNDGILKVGDIWSFTKTIVPRGGPSILIEKEAKVHYYSVCMVVKDMHRLRAWSANDSHSVSERMPVVASRSLCHPSSTSSPNKLRISS